MDDIKNKVQSPAGHSLDSRSEPTKPAGKAPQFRERHGAKTDQNQPPQQIANRSSTNQLVSSSGRRRSSQKRTPQEAVAEPSRRRHGMGRPHYWVSAGRGADA
ncbi:hypothetical protein V495_00169 [Pseudogymnoascus sp. VKM F-4514 (FW-929)]|nr:hypothetical protein V495_00169 [Pseudogymnoascus sp. VKM F-4514 (FW-929)]KFY67358.1 hypothetical protein V497_00406 [Pseudogymnoascus sp. VKM F-4516 (FW-969)]